MKRILRIAYLLHLLILLVVVLDILSAWKINPPHVTRKILLAGMIAWALAAAIAYFRSRDRSRFLDRFAKPMLVFYSCGLCLLGFEVVLRIAFKPAAISSSGQALLRRPGRYVFAVDRAIISGVSHDSVFTVNRVGLRGPDPPADSRTYKIITLGGSTTECWALDDEREWPHRLMLELQRGRPAVPVWVNNAGMSGHTAVQHLYALRRYPALDLADLWIFMTGVNDLAYAINREGRPTQQLLEQHNEEAFFIAPPPTRPFVTRLRTYQLASAIVVQVVRKLTGQTFYTAFLTNRRRLRATRPVLPLPDLAIPLAEYRQRLLRLAGECHAKRKRCLFLTQPTLWRDDLTPQEQALLWWGWVGPTEDPRGFVSVRDAARAMDMFNHLLLEVCREDHLECFDLASVIPKSTAVFFDDSHYNEAGAEQVAHAIAGYLRDTPPWTKP